MQTAALAAAGLAGQWTYGAIDVDPQAFPAKVADLVDEGYAGANVTIPHKEAALLLAAEASDRAREIGAANTLSFSGGEIVAENTDASGISAALSELRTEPGGSALVLGAGGSARAAVWALRSAGCDITVWNRTPERAEALARDLGAEAAGPDPDVAAYAVIVNATAVGLGAGDDESGGSVDDQALKGFPLSADVLSDRQVVVDLAYGSVDTPVIAAAKQAGARWVDGLEVLVRQGAESFRIWTGIDPPLDVMRRAARAGDTDDDRAPDTPSTGSAPGG